LPNPDGLFRTISC